MKESNKIYKIIIDSQYQLNAVELAFLTSPNNTDLSPKCYFVKDKEELSTLEQKITSIFHQNYFKLNQKPLVIFENHVLTQDFNKRINQLGLEKVKTMTYLNNNGVIFWVKNKDDLNALFNSERNAEKYFISQSEVSFDQWINNINEAQKIALTEKYQLEIEVQKKNFELSKLQNELMLIKESLAAVKTEYNKELSWYKREIEHIKNWYEEEHGKTPAIITKFFKKLF